MPGLAFLPPPDQIQDRWWGLWCLERPRLLERARTWLRSDSGSQCGSSSAGRSAGFRTNIAPAQAALPSPSLPQIPGVSPHTWVGVRVAEGAKKEPEAAAAEPQEPFYCTAKQGMSSSSGLRGTAATPELNPTQPEGPQGRGKWGPGGRREPHHIPSAPLAGPAA